MTPERRLVSHPSSWTRQTRTQKCPPAPGRERIVSLAADDAPVAAALMSATSVPSRCLRGAIIMRRLAWRLELARFDRFYLVALITSRMTRVTAAAAVPAGPARMATATVAEVHEEHPAYK